ncbi:MAG: hypothetical protein PHD97_12810 [Bacteroidales bacterium]|nr:hypothetical protein [Bacteroidales bacterium]
MLTRNKILILIVISLLCASSVYAQTINLFDKNYKTKKYTFEAGNNTEINSNVVSNEFISRTLSGGYIDDDMKSRVSQQLAESNKLGGEMNSYLKFTLHNDSAYGLSYYVNVKNCNYLNMKFSKDLFNLSFYGNKMFEGKTADMGNSKLNYISYDQISFGIVSRYKADELTYEFSIGLGVNLGRKSLNVNLEKGELFTQRYGEYIDFDARYDVSVSDTSKNPGYYYSGFGTCVSFSYSIENRRGDMFSISFENVGSIRWNKNSWFYYRPDTSFHYGGWEVPDFINMNNEMFDDANIDSIANKYAYKNKTSRFNTGLPSVFRIGYLYNAFNAVDFYAGIKYIINANYSPLFYLKTIINPDKYNFFSLVVSYGGYGNSNIFVNHDANFGLEFGHDFKNGFIFDVGSNYVNGFIYPRTTRGEGFYFGIKKII